LKASLLIQQSHILDTVFTDQFIADAFNLLIDHLLPMTDRDWEHWNEEPEEWLVESLDVSQAWSYDFRVSRGRTRMWVCVDADHLVFIAALC
jgi:hypothetical protein